MRMLLQPVATGDGVTERTNLSQNLVRNRTVAPLFIFDSLGLNLAAPVTPDGRTIKQVYADALTSHHLGEYLFLNSHRSSP